MEYLGYVWGAATPSFFKIPTTVSTESQELGDTYTLGNITFNLGKITLENILDKAYEARYSPKNNRINLVEYVNSEDFQKHALTACIYYNQKQLQEANDVLRIAYQREPTNFENTGIKYHKEGLKELFGYEDSVYNDRTALKIDGTPFSVLPNTVCVYAENYLWRYTEKLEFACLSLPAPALDSKSQPNYSYYMNADDELNTERYEEEMNFLFRVIKQTFQDHHKIAFGGKGIQRLVFTRFGQTVFLKGLTRDDKTKANKIYRQELGKCIAEILPSGVKIVMSEYSEPHETWYPEMTIGDIVETACSGDLIVNPWDPHSAPGNGNDGDRSFDGAMGRHTSILPTQSPWLNPNLRDKQSLRPV